MQNLTIFTDASHCSDNKVAGGAFWSRTEDKYLKHAYAFKDIPYAHEAELITAVCAVNDCLDHTTYADLWAPDAEKVLIILVVDCLTIKQAFENTITLQNPRIRTMVRGVLRKARSRGARIKVNHVKAHVGTGKPRNWVNNWCDREAKKKMRALRQRKISGELHA